MKVLYKYPHPILKCWVAIDLYENLLLTELYWSVTVYSNSQNSYVTNGSVKYTDDIGEKNKNMSAKYFHDHMF